MKLGKYWARASSVVWACLVLSARAEGAQPARIVLVGQRAPAFARALSAEAADLGLWLENGTGDDPSRAAEERGAVAAVRVLAPGRVELWFPEAHDSGALEASEVLVATEDEEETFAARIMEDVRAHLVKLDLLPGTASPATPPPERATPSTAPPAAPLPAPPRTAPESSTSRDATRARTPLAHPRNDRPWWAETGVGATVATGGVPGTLQAIVGLGASRGNFELEAFGLLPLTDATVTGREGSTDVSATLLGARARYVLSARDAALRGAVGAGSGALVLGMRGEASSPYVGHGESATTAAFFVDAGVSYRVAGWLGLRLSTLVGVCAPRPVVVFAGHDIATWGRTFGTLIATVELGMPVEREP
jgi:hypothetical protein